MFVVGCLEDIKHCYQELPVEVLNDLAEKCILLDYAYGSDRNYFQVGGYSVVLQGVADIEVLKGSVDIYSYICEWSSKVGESSYVSALYVLNDDFTIMVYLPIEIAPENILNSIE